MDERCDDYAWGPQEELEQQGLWLVSVTLCLKSSQSNWTCTCSWRTRENICFHAEPRPLAAVWEWDVGRQSGWWCEGGHTDASA